jgi:hypothetical protein
MYFHESSCSLPPTFIDTIIQTIDNSLSDTAYCNFERDFITGFDPSRYFIIEKSNKEYVTIHFEPYFLPDSLKIIYEKLYYDMKKKISSAMNDEVLLSDSLYFIFEKEIKRNNYKFKPKIVFMEPDIISTSTLKKKKKADKQNQRDSISD